LVSVGWGSMAPRQAQRTTKRQYRSERFLSPSRLQIKRRTSAAVSDECTAKAMRGRAYSEKRSAINPLDVQLTRRQFPRGCAEPASIHSECGRPPAGSAYDRSAQGLRSHSPLAPESEPDRG